MKKGQEIWVRWEDGTLNQLRLVREGSAGWEVVWLTGDLKGREAKIEKAMLREMANQK